MRSDLMMNEELMRRYLLGDLEHEEIDALEQAILQDGDLFELAEAIEGDLLAACAGGSLTEAEQEKVLRRLATSARGRSRLALARSLGELAAEAPPAGRETLVGRVLAFQRRLPLRQPAFRIAALAACLALVVGGLWLARQTARPEAGTLAVASPGAPETVAPTGETPVATAGQPAEPTLVAKGRDRAKEPTLTAAPDSGRVAEKQPAQERLAPVVIQLALSQVRSAAPPVISPIPAGSQEAVFHVALLEGEEADYTAFSAALKQGDREVRRWDQLEPLEIDGVPALVFSLPGKDLLEGDYLVELYGRTPEGASELIGAPEVRFGRTGS